MQVEKVPLICVDDSVVNLLWTQEAVRKWNNCLLLITNEQSWLGVSRETIKDIALFSSKAEIDLGVP